MSDYHILRGSIDGNSFAVVMHILVPDVDNEVGVNYRTVVVQAGLNPEVSTVPFVVAAEQAQLNDGELYEHMCRFWTHPGESLLAKRERLDALYITARTKIQAHFQHRLAYWGMSRDVP